MVRILIFNAWLFTVSFAGAEVVSQNKDWIGERDVMTILGVEGCVAQTTIQEKDPSGVLTNTYRLQVIKLKSPQGGYSNPIVVSFPDNVLSEAYFEGTAQTNNSKVISLTLLQPDNNLPAKVVGTRYSDRIDLTRRLRRDDEVTIGFKDQQDIVKSVQYSLSGSAKTIQETGEACQ
ncbi:MAG: hypothetical protein KDD33_00450 [Bdellovibrionales bacterium]|nr:hypothetical protein [Bdellovibrionales bacterium]